MALTRKALKAMGLTDEQVDSVIDMHTETVDALKQQRDEFKADADKLTGVQAELTALKSDGYKEKYEKINAAFEEYKASAEREKVKEAKVAAVRKYFEAAGITGKRLDIAMRGAGAEIDAAELDGENLKDTAALDALIKGDFAGLVGTTVIRGATVEHPPMNNAAAKSEAEIYAKNDKGRYKLSTAERQKAIAEKLATDTTN